MDKHYQIEYLPAAQKDLLDTTRYIKNKLNAPAAARNFRTRLGEAVERLSRFPYSCRVYNAGKPLAYEVRLLPVGNFNVYYVVEENCVLIHRVIYGKRDMREQEFTLLP